MSLNTGTALPILFEDFHHLLEELVTRIENLPLGVAGIVSVLDDQHYGIHRQLVPAAPQGLLDGGVDLKAELAGPGLALISLGLLVDIQGDHVHFREVPPALAGITHQKAITEMLSMGQIGPDGGDDGQFFPFFGGWLSGAAQMGRQAGGRGYFQKGPSAEHQLLQKVDSWVGW